jgi:hypothetical protein
VGERALPAGTRVREGKAVVRGRPSGRAGGAAPFAGGRWPGRRAAPAQSRSGYMIERREEVRGRPCPEQCWCLAATS